jgi:hypothetical protein
LKVRQSIPASSWIEPIIFRIFRRLSSWGQEITTHGHNKYLSSWRPPPFLCISHTHKWDGYDYFTDGPFNPHFPDREMDNLLIFLADPKFNFKYVIVDVDNITHKRDF